MTKPLEKDMEEFNQTNITGTWQEKLFNRFGVAVIGFAFAAYIYVDYRQLNKDQFTNIEKLNNRIFDLVESNGKIASATNQALTDLSKQVESSRVEKNKNLDKMDASLVKLIEALNNIQANTKEKPNN